MHVSKDRDAGGVESICFHRIVDESMKNTFTKQSLETQLRNSSCRRILRGSPDLEKEWQVHSTRMSIFSSGSLIS